MQNPKRFNDSVIENSKSSYFRRRNRKFWEAFLSLNTWLKHLFKLFMNWLIVWCMVSPLTHRTKIECMCSFRYNRNVVTNAFQHIKSQWTVGSSQIFSFHPSVFHPTSPFSSMWNLHLQIYGLVWAWLGGWLIEFITYEASVCAVVYLYLCACVCEPWWLSGKWGVSCSQAEERRTQPHTH